MNKRKIDKIRNSNCGSHKLGLLNSKLDMDRDMDMNMEPLEPLEPLELLEPLLIAAAMTAAAV
jgi:hypothetical protein